MLAIIRGLNDKNPNNFTMRRLRTFIELEEVLNFAKLQRKRVGERGDNYTLYFDIVVFRGSLI